MPQKEAYEVYDPVIGRNFDIKNFWLRADLRVRPEWRNGVCFGGGTPATACTAAQRTNSGTDGSADADMFIFYNQIKSIPGFLVEPYYVLYINNLAASVNSDGLGAPKHADQVRHMFGGRIEMRKGNWDLITENAWQTGRMGSGLANANGTAQNQRNLTINAWATRNWIGYTFFEHKWKPRFAVGFDYASGDGQANCATNAGTGNATATAGMTCKTANTFENFFPTNYIHAGYMLNHAWRNSIQAQVNIQARPTARDHIEFWGQLHYLASARDNWYRGAQGPAGLVANRQRDDPYGQ